MIALARFQITGFLRSYRFVPPALVVLLYVILVLKQAPGPEYGRDLTVGTYGDSAALMFPVWAWAAKCFLDTEPDGQRELTAVAAGGRFRPVAGGLLGAYVCNAATAGLVLALPLVHGVIYGVGVAAMLGGAVLTFLSALAGTVAGAFTCRALMPSPAASVFSLVGGSVLVLMISMSPLGLLSIPMIGWLRAAHHGPEAFNSAMPGVALHLTVWCTVVAAAYTAVRFRVRGT